MEGKWIGKYWCTGDVPESVRNQVSEFEMTIENFNSPNISGRVIDKVEDGGLGMAGVGTISGKVNGHQLKFVKRMPIKTSIMPDGKRIEENRPHKPIFYKGKINYELQTVVGTWRMKIGFGKVNGQFVFYPGTKGKWEMKKA